MTIEDPKTIADFKKNKYSEEQIRNFIKKYPKKLNKQFWWNISEYQILSEDFIREFKDYVFWWNISTCQTLSELFIREFKDKVNWWCISKNQKISEDFIREFKNKVDWWYISADQNLSEPFMIEFIKDIKIGNEFSWGLKSNEKIPEEVKNRIIDLKKVIDQ